MSFDPNKNYTNNERNHVKLATEVVEPRQIETLKMLLQRNYNIKPPFNVCKNNEDKVKNFDAILFSPNKNSEIELQSCNDIKLLCESKVCIDVISNYSLEVKLNKDYRYLDVLFKETQEKIGFRTKGKTMLMKDSIIENGKDIFYAIFTNKDNLHNYILRHYEEYIIDDQLVLLISAKKLLAYLESENPYLIAYNKERMQMKDKYNSAYVAVPILDIIHGCLLANRGDLL